MAFSAFQFSYDPETGSYNLDELNHYLVGKLVKSKKFEFCLFNGYPTWSCIIEWEYAKVEPNNPSEKKTYQTQTIEQKAPEEPKAALILDENEKALYDQLRAWRFESAKISGLATFMIAHNSQLVEIIKSRPKTLEEIAKIKGMGPRKAAQFGPQLLEILSRSAES